MVYREHAVTPVPTMGWKTPFNLAILLHFLILSSAVILPKYLSKNTITPEIYTVDLVSVTDSLPQADAPRTKTKTIPSPPPKPIVKVQKLKSVQARKTVPIAPPLAEETTTVSTKPVSLKPLKRKIKNRKAQEQHTRQLQEKKRAEQKRKEIAREATRERVRQQALEEKRQRLLSEARRQQALAAAEAESAAAAAVNALKHSLQANAAVNSATASERKSTKPGGATSSALESQYYASIFAHLHQFWALPDIKTWDPDTSATVVIVIDKNGTIISHTFEKRSGDRVFDQFVSKTITDANPLPAIPGALKRQQYKIGLRFKPGGIH